jgi:hypothetical protein
MLSREDEHNDRSVDPTEQQKAREQKRPGHRVWLARA